MGISSGRARSQRCISSANDGAAGTATTRNDRQSKHGATSFSSDIRGWRSLHALWWDSRNDTAYSPKRPIGNDASGKVNRRVGFYATTSPIASTWTTRSA